MIENSATAQAVDGIRLYHVGQGSAVSMGLRNMI